MSDNATISSTKHRSPAYPSFSLRTAVAKMRVFYDAQKRNSVHVDIAAETLGYKMKSGSGLRAIAALISFGLMEETGSGENRMVKLTPLANKIRLLQEEDPDRTEAIRESARKPKIYEEMLQQWSEGLPSDGAINKHLTFDKNFNPEIVHLLIRDFKDTYEYAQLSGNSTKSVLGKGEQEVADMEIDSEEEPEDSLFNLPSVIGTARAGVAATQTKPQSSARVLTIPITGGRTALLNIPFDISEEDFKFLQTYLRLMKDAIVTGKVSEADGNVGAASLSET